MEPLDFAPEREKDDAARVGDAAAKKQPQRERRDRLHDGREHEEGEPAHRKIQRHRNDLDDLVVHGDGVHRNADERAQPLDDKHPKPERSAVERDHAVGRIGARNEKIDGAVIEDAEDALGAAVGQGVIERAHRIEDDDARSEDGDRRHRRRVGIGEKERQAPRDESEERPRDVRNGVEDLLAFRIKGTEKPLLLYSRAERARCRLLHMSLLSAPPSCHKERAPLSFALSICPGTPRCKPIL